MIFRLTLFGILIIAALIALYYLTRNKWDWNSYAGTIAITLACLLLIPVGMFTWVSYENRTRVLTEFSAIQLGSNTANVKFIKGEPSETTQFENSELDLQWRYIDRLNRNNYIDVGFSNGKVVEIGYTGSCQYCEMVNGFGIGSLHEDLIKRFGDPTDRIISDNELEHRLNYAAYHMFFILKEGKVVRHGIYQPKNAQAPPEKLLHQENL